MSSVVILTLMFVMFCHFVIEVIQEGVNFENICYIVLEYIVMYAMWLQIVLNTFER